METFIVPGEPAPWTAQMKRAERSKAFVNMQAYQTAIQAHVKTEWAGRDLIQGPIHLEMEFYRGMPQDVPWAAGMKSDWQIEHIQRKPDWLNYFKAAEDALQGILFANDSQVISGKGLKWYTSEKSGFTIIRVRPLTDSEIVFGTRMSWAQVGR